MKKTIKYTIFFLIFVCAIFLFSCRNDVHASIYDDITFDAEFYLSANTDVRAAYGNNYSAAHSHYIVHGKNEPRPTSICFDVRYYVDTYKDLKRAFGNNYREAYNHFITFGIKEGRMSSPFFDVQYYLNTYPDLKRAYGNNYREAYNHFITFGIKEGRRGSKFFDAQYYINSYPDLKKAFGNNYRQAYYHYVSCGMNEGRNPCSDININCYLNSYSDLKKAFGNNYKSAAEHYYYNGIYEGRYPNHKYSEKVESATCSKPGRKIYTCLCGSKYEVVIPATGNHTWDKGIHTNAVHTANSLVAGYTTYTCTKCGEKKVTKESAPTHTMQVIAGKSETCKDAGYTSYKQCTVCGYIEGKVTIPSSPSKHTWDSGVVTPPVHTSSQLVAGYTTYTCTICKTTRVEYGPTPTHNLQSISAKAPNCKEDGYSSYQKCSICDYTIGKTTYPKTPDKHTWDNGVVTPAIHTAEQLVASKTTYTCTVCGQQDVKTGQTPSHQLYYIPGKPATCSEVGYTGYKQCAICSYIADKNELQIDSSNHVLDSGVKTPPVHTKDELKAGYTTYHCTLCQQEVVKDQTEVPTHNLICYLRDSGTHTSKGSEHLQCTVCDYTEDNELPVLHEGSLQTENEVSPTCTTNGYKNVKCNICGYTDRITLNRLSENGTHTLVDDESAPAKEPTCTELGNTQGQKCTVCSYTVPSKSIPMVNHTQGELVQDVETIHEENRCVQGYTEYKCKVCQQNYKEYKKVQHGNSIVTIQKAEHTKDSFKPTTNIYTCSICKQITRTQPINDEYKHKIVTVGEQEATCGSPGHGAGTRCLVDDCTYNEPGGGATAPNTTSATGSHTYEYRDLTEYEKLGSRLNAVQIHECTTCKAVDPSDNAYITLPELFKTVNTVVIYGDMTISKLEIPKDKTLIVFGALGYFYENTNNGTIYYNSLKPYSIVPSLGADSIKGTLVDGEGGSQIPITEINKSEVEQFISEKLSSEPEKTKEYGKK